MATGLWTAFLSTDPAAIPPVMNGANVPDGVLALVEGPLTKVAEAVTSSQIP